MFQYDGEKEITIEFVSVKYTFFFSNLKNVKKV